MDFKCIFFRPFLKPRSKNPPKKIQKRKNACLCWYGVPHNLTCMFCNNCGRKSCKLQLFFNFIKVVTVFNYKFLLTQLIIFPGNCFPSNLFICTFMWPHKKTWILQAIWTSYSMLFFFFLVTKEIMASRISQSNNLIKMNFIQKIFMNLLYPDHKTLDSL